MASNVSSKIRIAADKATSVIMTREVVKQGTRAAMAVEVDMIRKRSRARIDNKGKRFPPYSPQWKKRKAQMIKGKMKDRRTPFAAKNVDDGMALSGRTQSDLFVKSVKVTGSGAKIAGEGVIDARSKRSQDIIEGNAARGRDIRGPAPANTSQGKKEIEAMSRAFRGAAKLPRNAKINIS